MILAGFTDELHDVLRVAFPSQLRSTCAAPGSERLGIQSGSVLLLKLEGFISSLLKVRC